MPAEKVTGQVPEGPYPFTKHERTLLMRGFGSHRMLCGSIRIRVKRNIPLSGDLKKRSDSDKCLQGPGGTADDRKSMPLDLPLPLQPSHTMS